MKFKVGDEVYQVGAPEHGTFKILVAFNNLYKIRDEGLTFWTDNELELTTKQQNMETIKEFLELKDE